MGGAGNRRDRRCRVTAWIAVLLTMSAAAELFGTVTVWKNYSYGARLAEEILTDVERDQILRDKVMGVQSAKYLLSLTDPVVGAITGNDASERIMELRTQIGHYLGRKCWVSAGLLAYVGGAVTGLAAGYLALFR
jgi:hypothetical protein